MKIAKYNRLGDLWVALARHTNLCLYVTERDHTRFLSQLDGEGLPYLTTLLPSLGKALESSFNTGQFVSPEGFKCVKGRAYPLFLQRAFCRILKHDGSLRSREEIDADAVVCIRQLTLLFYKLKLGFTPEQELEALQEFKNSEKELLQFEPMWKLIGPSEVDKIDPWGFEETTTLLTMLQIARKAVYGLFAGRKPEAKRPRHGSGASACGVTPHKRYGTFRFIPRLDAMYPYEDNFFFNKNHWDSPQGVRWWMEREEVEPPAKVTFVEKDSRGPRIISMEPRELMYMQQSLMREMYGIIQDKSVDTALQLDCKDQQRNRDAAQCSSLTNSTVTLDLSKASDKVSWNLVKYLFPPDWVDALAATRSLHTMLPDGTRMVPLKFAPMGSALCFPVEAICFWALSHAATLDLRFLKRTLKGECTSDDPVIRVFGDDIVCEKKFSHDTMRLMESVGLEINRSKSYLAGPFRESCGGDFLNGADVSIVRCNNLIEDCVGNDKTPMFRTVECINNIINRYGFGTLGLELTMLARAWYGPIPRDNSWTMTDPYGNVVYANNHDAWRWRHFAGTRFSPSHGGCSILSPVCDVPDNVPFKWNPKLQRFEYRLHRESPVQHQLDGIGWSLLLRHICQGVPERDSAVYTVPRRTKSTLTWCYLGDLEPIGEYTCCLDTALSSYQVYTRLPMVHPKRVPLTRSHRHLGEVKANPRYPGGVETDVMQLEEDKHPSHFALPVTE
jgi:hypothetical protein